MPVKIKNIIFDVGGVIQDIDMKSTIDAFIKLGATNASVLFTDEGMKQLIVNFGKGELTETEFRHQLQEKLQIKDKAGVKKILSDKEFDDAWNAMLGNIPEERLTYINDLATKGYKIFILSDTNSIHLRYISKSLGLHHISTTTPFRDKGIHVEHEYYSFLTGQRKSDKPVHIYEKIIKENSFELDHNRAIFMDDNLDFVRDAQEAGLFAVQLHGELTHFDMEKYIKRLEQAAQIRTIPPNNTMYTAARVIASAGIGFWASHSLIGATMGMMVGYSRIGEQITQTAMDGSRAVVNICRRLCNNP